MDKPAAISGDFANYRPVLGRKVLQLIIEVPIEAQQHVFEALGFPTGGGAVPVAIVRLETPFEQPVTQPPSRSPAVRDAGIVCKEPEFWEFLNQETPARLWSHSGIKSEADAAAYVRMWCNVESRREIRPGSYAEHVWNRLLLDYGAWRARRAEKRYE